MVATSGSGTPQNGWLPASASHRITPTAQTSLRSEASSPPSRSGEMYASVPGTSPTAVSVSASSNCASPKSSTRTEISLLSSTRTFEGLTSRWMIPLRCACASAVEDLRGDLDRLGVVELLRPERLAQRAAPHVLVGDVDVAGVAAEVVGPHAALVAQA